MKPSISALALARERLELGGQRHRARHRREAAVGAGEQTFLRRELQRAAYRLGYLLGCLDLFVGHVDQPALPGRDIPLARTNGCVALLRSLTRPLPVAGVPARHNHRRRLPLGLPSHRMPGSNHIVSEPRAFSAALQAFQFVVRYLLRDWLFSSVTPSVYGRRRGDFCDQAPCRRHDAAGRGCHQPALHAAKWRRRSGQRCDRSHRGRHSAKCSARRAEQQQKACVNRSLTL
ncbi:hypothetical protein ACAN107058_07770 [Paracidovorax anthurii]|uniref:Uncharacterized protein n=1 Tax=Paracidovorax anthurii TaxID=78229 RepID=A0A328YSV5_9BURK|nr:hypothetical protein AX018_104727 [Paracidovorax anthurii]